MLQLSQEAIKDTLSAAGIIDRSKPTTGVFNLNSLEFINEEIDNGIDFIYEDYCRQCQTHHGHDIEACDCDYEQPCPGTYFIGFKEYDPETKRYDIDENAEYSAIVNCDSNTVQVLRSVWYMTGGLCSPCYPGQVDADSLADDIPAFSLPPSVIGFNGQEDSDKLHGRVNLLEHREVIDDGLAIWNRSEYEDYKHRDRHDRHSQNYYKVILSAFTAGLVVANNGQDALDIAIDHATAQKWDELFLFASDILVIVAEHVQDCFDMDYINGGNEGRYLSSLNVAIQELGTYPPVRQ